MSNNKVLSSLQKLGKALMTPIAVLPAAGLLLRLGQKDVFNLPWMAAAGSAIFSNLAIIFAIGIAVGLAEENNGVAGIAAAVGYFVLTKVATAHNAKIDMGVLAGIISGVIAANLYNKYKDIKVPQFLGFFGGKRFVPIATSMVTLILGLIAGYVWPPIQDALNGFGNWIVGLGTLGAFIFGLLNRLLIPVGLHHVMNTIFWFEFGTFTDAAGNIVKGDLNRFFALDPNSGIFMTGFFPIMMFALPAACFAMITAAKKENRKEVSGMLFSIAFTAILTGITEPIEFTFMFLAPVLYVIHAILTGASLAICYALGIRSGFTFSAGAIDFGLNFGISQKPVLLIGVGLIFAAIYYFIFLFAIKKFNLQTPGREIKNDDENVRKAKKVDVSLDEKAEAILKYIGGKENVDSIDACVTRIRLSLKDVSMLNESEIKKLGVSGIMKMGKNNVQIVIGTLADPLVTRMKQIMK